jgi:Protein of unknown function (DUF3164)
MANIIKKDGKTYWIDVDGDPVPLSSISKEQKQDDRLVEGVFSLVNRYQKYTKKIKGKILEKIGDTDRKTFYNYDKSKKLEIITKNRIEFDDKLEKALDLIIQFFEKEQTSERTMLAIKKMFRRNRRGDADPGLLLRLKELGFKDDLWEDATRLVAESQTVLPMKTYRQFSHRNEDGEWVKDKLNFSAI